MNDSVHDPIISSMLWAAYGDALGFMSELVDHSGLERRIGADSVRDTVPWLYRVGGRHGTEVQLPAGMYSDDTQLRLATARAIGPGGEFNVDAFAKVELPVWLSYALGGGKGTKAAAHNLARDNVSWHSNFYNSTDARYLDSGGNGAAMRIQPHVWAARSGSHDSELMLNVTRNSVSTHGHPRALVGALFHALALADTLREGRIPAPERWASFLVRIRSIPAIVANDEYLGLIWLTAWEQQLGSFTLAISSTLEECIQDVEEFISLHRHGSAQYLDYVKAIGATSRATQGSGTKTAVASLALAWLFRDNPTQAMLVSANALGTDTDTIGTMAGALLGVVTQEKPPGRVCDSDLLTQQAERLSRIRRGANIADFSYPSLLSWKPPRTASDSVGKIGNEYGIAGLGLVKPLDDKTYETSDKHQALFRWVTTAFGQTMLVKTRPNPTDLTSTQLPSTSVPLLRPSPDSAGHRDDKRQGRRPEGELSVAPRGFADERQVDLNFNARTERTGSIETRRTNPGRSLDLETLTNEVIRARFDPKVIGEAFLALCEQEHSIEKTIAFAAILSKAVTARRSR